MFPAKITFGTNPLNVSLSELGDLLDGYLVSLQKAGQIAGDGLHASSAAGTVAFVNLVRPDSCERQFHSSPGLQDLDALTQLFGQPPVWESLSTGTTIEFLNWKDADEFFLESAMPDGLSPLREFDSAECIPMYQIPLEFDVRERLYFWSREYNRMDGIWFSSGDLENQAYQQMAAPDSRLSRDGRELAAAVEAAIGKPVYYFLACYDCTDEEESSRVCPGCGNGWSMHSLASKFTFKCTECRLVSAC